MSVHSDIMLNYMRPSKKDPLTIKEAEIAYEETGCCEVKTQFGSIDVLTSSKVIELKTAFNYWKHKWIYLFDSVSPERTRICRRKGTVHKLKNEFNIV